MKRILIVWDLFGKGKSVKIRGFLAYHIFASMKVKDFDIEPIQRCNEIMSPTAVTVPLMLACTGTLKPVSSA